MIKKKFYPKTRFFACRGVPIVAFLAKARSRSIFWKNDWIDLIFFLNESYAKNASIEPPTKQLDKYSLRKWIFSDFFSKFQKMTPTTHEKKFPTQQIFIQSLSLRFKRSILNIGFIKKKLGQSDNYLKKESICAPPKNLKIAFWDIDRNV